MSSFNFDFVMLPSFAASTFYSYEYCLKPSHQCQQHRRRWNENFENSTMIPPPTGSWIRSRRRRDRIQLPFSVEIIVEFFMTTGREGAHTLDRDSNLCTRSFNTSKLTVSWFFNTIFQVSCSSATILQRWTTPRSA